jgi:anaerobic magnesium-protoporphyrin IX monomethyl ester cyclase
MSAFFPRVTFVVPPTGPYCREDRCQSYFTLDLIPSMRPPLEETQAAGGVREAGGASVLIDAPAEGLTEAETLRRVSDANPSLVVLSATFGSLEDDLAFAAALKRRVDAPIALRGAPAYTHAEEILGGHPQIDLLLRGDYELVLADLVRVGPESAAGVVRRNGKGLHVSPPPNAPELDTLPREDRSILKPELYRVRGTGRAQATIHVQRGCPFPCTYCLVGTVSGRKARHRSPASVASEVRQLWSEGYRDFYLRADTFTLDAAWARETAVAISSAAPGARWVTATRVDTLDDETIAVLAKNGCYGLSFGVETGSAEIGAHIKKRPDLKQTEHVFRTCDAHGIATLMYVMLGFLWETPQTLAETERFVRAVRPDLLTLYWAHPHPGTAYEVQVREAGVTFRQAFAQAKSALEPPGISASEIRRRALVMTARHYAQPRVIASMVRKLGPVLLPAAGRWLAA